MQSVGIKKLSEISKTQIEIPSVGFGTWKCEPKVTEDNVFTALKAGYRHIDCAPMYGNEKEVGNAITKFLGEQKSVERKDIFITSKLWNTHHHPEHVKEACLRSLKDLQVDYLDLFLIHWPIPFEFKGFDLAANIQNRFPRQNPADPKSPVELALVPISATWKAMESLVEEGLVKHIGVSNFGFQILLELISNCKIKPAVNQIECHPYHNRARLHEMHQRLGIKTTAFCPLGNGREHGPISSVELKAIADRIGKSVPQVALKWNVQRGVVVLPKSSNEKHIIDNLNLDFELSKEDMDTIDGLDKLHHFQCIDPALTWFWPIFE